jgi:RHS repeat-associated protein
MSYTYNLSGALIEQTYPSGRKIKNTFDTDGELESVKSQKSSNAALRTHASNFVRNSAGAITSMKLGNGLYETAKVNDRLQITELALGTTNLNANLWKVNFDYGTTNNNGNILSQTVNTGASTFVQTYQYDSLNRITEAKEVNGAQQTWKQNFGYDRFGNRTQFSQIVGSEQLQINNLTLPQIDAASNRFAAGQGYEYDSNGNLTKDAAQGQNFTFNGENKISEVKDSANNVIAIYFYDGNAKRVKKITVEEVVIFVYDANSRLIAEYSTKKVDDPKISYITRDHLGTPRVMTDYNRQVISRRDYMPFGETITASRSAAQKYGIEDNIRQGFTGYQKDKETGLDFAEARYYNSNHGKFTSVDPLLASGKGPNPQSFNRYVYCINRPLVAIDPSGLSYIIVLVDSERNAKIYLIGLNVGYMPFKASTKGQGGRTQMGGDTPFGLYKFSGTEGGNYDFRSERLGRPGAWGTGIITTTPTSVGEGSVARRSGIFIHGGGGSDPFAPTQGCNCLPSTLGCIKMYNQDVNTLIGYIKEGIKEGDPLDNIFVGDKDYLMKLAKEKDSRGKWKYPQLRTFFALDVRADARTAPVLKFQDFDPYAVDEPALDGDIEEDTDGSSALNEDDDEEYEGSDEVATQEYEQPHDYG